MRNLHAILFVLCASSAAGEVWADVGPAPKCPEGTYSAYLKGRRCVKNGYVLVQDADGNVRESRGPEPVAAPRAPESEPIAPIPPEKAADKPPEKSPGKPAQASGCAMSTHPGRELPSLPLLSALSLLLLTRRRRPSAVATSRI